MSAIVIYYSRTGNTRFVAETIASFLNGELAPLKDKKNRRGIIGWILAGRDAFMEKLTELEPVNVNLEKHDLIFLGCPNWASKLPPALRTFVGAQDFANKKVVLFCTQDALGAEQVFNNLRRLLPLAEIIGEKFFNKVNKNQDAIRLQIKDWLAQFKNE